MKLTFTKIGVVCQICLFLVFAHSMKGDLMSIRILYVAASLPTVFGMLIDSWREKSKLTATAALGYLVLSILGAYARFWPRRFHF